MIICHCQNISDHDIHAAIDWMRAADPETLITPGKIYRALGKDYHEDCFKCQHAGCNVVFGDDGFYEFNSTPYCQLQRWRCKREAHQVRKAQV